MDKNLRVKVVGVDAKTLFFQLPDERNPACLAVPMTVPIKNVNPRPTKEDTGRVMDLKVNLNGSLPGKTLDERRERAEIVERRHRYRPLFTLTRNGMGGAW